MEQQRVLLGMSGGMDSSMSAVLLQEQGYEVIGATLLTHTDKNDESIVAAQQLASERQIKHHLIDCKKEFKETVIQYFSDEYLQGRTPNPCIRCNETIKWKLLLELADQLNCHYIATGHYVQKEEIEGQWYIKKGIDPNKDQSYFLWNLNQPTISRALFPLGELHKDEVRTLARKCGYDHFADKKESMGVCFLSGTDYRDYIKHLLGNDHPAFGKGLVVDQNKNVLGHHEGFPFYTIGQRRGIVGVAKGMCVVAIDAKNKQLIAGDRDFLLRSSLQLTEYSLTSNQSLWFDRKVFIRIRGLDSVPGYDGRISRTTSGLSVKFDNDVWAVTPGQSIVFYQNDCIIGGGIL